MLNTESPFDAFTNHHEEHAMSLSSNPPSDWPTVSELLDEALALRAHELETWFASLQGARLAYKEEVRTLMALRTFVDARTSWASCPR